MARRSVGREVDQRRAAGGGEVAARHALRAKKVVDLGTRAALDDRDVGRLGRGRRRGEDLQHGSVGHAELQVVGAGPQVAPVAGQRGADLEEEPGRDHALMGQLVADLPGRGMGGNRHRRAARAAIRGTVGTARSGTRSPRPPRSARAARRCARPTSACGRAARFGPAGGEAEAACASGRRAAAPRPVLHRSPGSADVPPAPARVPRRCARSRQASDPPPSSTGASVPPDASISRDASISPDTTPGWLASQPSSRCAAARESSSAVPPIRSASRVVKRSS